MGVIFLCTNSTYILPGRWEPIATECDFENYQILTEGMGVRSGDRCSLVVQSVVENEEVVDISALEIRLGANCLPFLGVSYPFSDCVN